MNKNDQRIAIANACGWTDIRSYIMPRDNSNSPEVFFTGVAPGVEYREKVSDYPNDLNAMHEAEKVLMEKEWEDYEAYLETMLSPERNWIHATASKRAEAFLKTINKWEESQ